MVEYIIDMSSFPSGGYGAVLLPRKPVVGHPSVTEVLETLERLCSKQEGHTFAYDMHGGRKSLGREEGGLSGLVRALIGAVGRCSAEGQCFDGNSRCLKVLFRRPGRENGRPPMDYVNLCRMVARIGPEAMMEHTPHVHIAQNKSVMFSLTAAQPFEVKGATATAANAVVSPGDVIHIMPMVMCQGFFVENEKAALDLCKSVRFLNENGIFHRDIKKENAMVCGQISPKLVDFGNAIVDPPPPSSSPGLISREAWAERLRNDGFVNNAAQVFFRNQTVHPYGNAVFHQRGMDVEQRQFDFTRTPNAPLTAMLLSRSAVADAKKLVKAYEHLPVFDRYVLHKNDCFALAVMLHSANCPSLMVGGGLFDCFRAPKVNPHGFASEERSMKGDLLFDMCAFDEADFHRFREVYERNVCHVSNRVE